MKPHSKYVNSVSKLKSIRSGQFDMNSQLGDIVKAVHSERMGKRESTKEAIKFSIKENKHYILKMCAKIDKHKGKVDKKEFIKILRTYGIFPSQKAISK